MLTVACANAKFILSGEHFVVDGTHSVVIPADCFTTQVSLLEQSQPFLDTRCTFECDVPPTPKEINKFEGQVRDLAYQACKILNLPEDLDGMRCVVKSNIPPGQGAGSSSALCRAMIEAMIKEFISSEPVHTNYLQWYGTNLENTFHGPVSGVDNAVIAYKKPLFFCKGEQPKVLNPTSPIYFAVGSVGPRPSYPTPYEIMRLFRKHSPLEFEKYRVDMEENACKLADVFVSSSPSRDAQIGDLMLESFGIFRHLGLIPMGVAEYMLRAVNCGAYGVRMTGAGNGGFIIAIAEHSKLDNILNEWKQMGLHDVKSICIHPD